MADSSAEQHDLLGLVVERLSRAGIAYMVSGSLASSLHGEPRMTRDIDVVIDGTADQLQRFADSFDPPDYYVTDPLVALTHRSMFTVVEVTTGWKVDLMIRKDRPFSRAELERRIPARIGSVDLMVVSPEDAILSKLEWMKLSDSDRQLGDVVGMIAANKERLDWAYVNHWAEELAVAEQLRTATREAEA